MISWGLRMAIAGTLPVLWGIYTGNISDAVWMTLTAEAITWVELKGSFAWRIRILLACSLFAIVFSVAGTLTAAHIWLSVICMFGIGFFATVLKNMGDRASGLALSVYLMYIISNAYPVTEFSEIRHRSLLVVIGAAWPVIVGLAASLLMPAQQPFRRQIAVIWRSVAAQAQATANLLSGVRQGDFYLIEKDVRKAIDASYQFYGRMAHQVNEKDEKYQLYMLRKIAGIVSANLAAITEDAESLRGDNIELKTKLATLYSALQEALSRMAVFVISLRPEDKLLTISHINRTKKLAGLVKQYAAAEQEHPIILKMVQHTERSVKLMESGLVRIGQMGDDLPVFRSYSHIKTSLLLTPQHISKHFRSLLDINTHAMKYALRSAVAVTVALFAYKWFKIDHGYWIPFSVMIIMQPYFGATFKRATDRIIGTLAGGIAGSLFLYLPTGLHLKEAVLFFSFIFMVYYLRKNYAIAAFVITLNLVLLFNIESSFDNMLMVTRALCTVGGALLAIAAGFLLLPTWDRKWLPAHLAEAIKSNYDYFIATFYKGEQLVNWTKFKRAVEFRNGNVFDSFNRYMQEPGEDKSTIYYDLTMHNIRITRNLNNIHLEQDEKLQDETADITQQQKIDQCLMLFAELMQSLSVIDNSVSSPFSPLKNGDTVALNEAQLISLQKMSIEIKSMLADMQKLSTMVHA